MSELFVWTQEYSVDVAEMDEQHKQFVKLGNDVIAYVKDSASGASDPDALRLLLHRLGDYALYHLGSEEEYFEKFGCENTDRHLFAHKQFRETLHTYMSRYEQGSSNAHEFAEEIASFCVKWLLTHILSMDKSYTTCFHVHKKY